eukprot:CAMPEP_0194347898 /NCGR_PEP_ID=MMETSP0171-20130528/106242_1 /TAXON_ID=218684 /ORGANISM="Corethron pennatum, Strain L29A3" /LENGTH=731 /DNA_ID=CAMNT_0039115193 /DNA_START=182 /DNA_END=2378 /DNA_ORIENTATION=-
MRTITPSAHSSNSDVLSSSPKTATWLARFPYRMMKTTAPHHIALLFLLLFAASSPLAASSGTPPPYAVPSFSAGELRNPSDGSLARLLAALSSSGIIAIEIGALAAGHPADPLCDLFQSCAASPMRADGGGGIVTEDVGGGAVRTTIATATRGLQDRHPIDARGLSLHARAYCGTEGADGRAALSNMDGARRAVSVAAGSHLLPAMDAGRAALSNMDGARRAVSVAAGSHLLPAMDRLLSDARGGGAGPLLVERGESPTEHFSLRSVVSSAENLEHFRVYSSPPEDGGADDDTLRGHTDGGLFLAFLPGRSCGGGDGWDDLSLLVEVGGKMMQAVFPAPADGGSVVGIMMGEGMENWLNYNGASPFRATKHAVRMGSGSTRAWYGMMFLVPPDTVVQKKPVVRTFAQIRESVGRGGGDDRNFVGCNRGPFRPDDVPSNTMRRVSAGHQDPSVCNNSTNFYCWMTCQNLPEADHKEALINAGNSLYCADPAIVDNRDLSEGVSVCTQGGVAGGAMDAAMRRDLETDRTGGAYLYHRGYRGGGQRPAERGGAILLRRHVYVHAWVRVGGVDMYSLPFQGFSYHVTHCICVYLSGDDPVRSLFRVARLWKAEGYRCVRSVEKQDPEDWGAATMYGIQLAAGYALMLVIMTYSAPLVCSVVLGLSIGHFWVAWDQEDGAAVVTGGTPCCSNFLTTPNECQKSRDTELTLPLPKIESENDEEDYNCCSGQENGASP